jgi:hypothetical protein
MDSIRFIRCSKASFLSVSSRNKIFISAIVSSCTEQLCEVDWDGRACEGVRYEPQATYAWIFSKF